jgi:hypothetical protein
MRRAAILILLLATGCAKAPAPDPLADTEASFLAFLDAANAAGAIESGLYTDYEGRDLPAWQALERQHRAEFTARLDGVDAASLSADQANALTAMRRTFRDYAEETAPGAAPPTCADASNQDAGFAALTGALAACFRELGNQMPFEGGTISRGTALQLLHDIEEPERRKAVFDAFKPLWKALNGNNEPDSPYRRVIRLAAEDAKTKGSYIDQAALALGVSHADIERWLIEMLEAWRVANDPQPIEPWDFRHAIGAANRLLADRIPPDALLPLNQRYYLDLGANLQALGVVHDLAERPDKSPLAYCDFLVRGRYEPDGAWRPTIARIVGSYPRGGLFSMNELVHENGHAVHISAIRNRPAFTDWPDTIFTEAFADVPAWSVYEPAWQQKYLATAIDAKTSLRAQFGGVILDVAWSLFELRMLRDPTLDPNAVWTDITRHYLHIKPHPELPWWAMRVQLGGNPGYMIHYGLGAVLTAEIRKRAAEVIGPMDAGNAQWYAWSSEKLLRFGSERDTRELMQELLGRPPNSAAVLEQLRRMDEAGSD